MRWCAFLLLLAGHGGAWAGTVTSAGPEKVAVTIYRDPDRGGTAMDRRWPGGYALITETRTLTLPAGASTIRFEGVADGLLPESAIVTGLPGMVKEKNRDGRLLSPGALVGANLMRRVTLRRTDRATGRATESEALLRSGPDNGVIVETAEGVEALGCAGLSEQLTYASVPEGLSAKPTLSVEMTAERPVTATVTLTYLSEGFDWDAAYAVDLKPEDRERADLFGWVTLANGGTTSFDRAAVSLIAGDVNRTGKRQPPPDDVPSLVLRCWPMDTTATHPSTGEYPLSPPPAPMMVDAITAEDTGEIVVSGLRRIPGVSVARNAKVVAAITVEQESLGDLKLYRVPEAVTVAAQGQKQVALVVKDDVQVERLFAARFNGEMIESSAMSRELRSKNRTNKGLGVPLPAGAVAVYATSGADRRIVIGEDRIDDRAIGEDIKIPYGVVADVRWSATPLRRRKSFEDWGITITNATDNPIDAEIAVDVLVGTKPKSLVQRDGRWHWIVSVPANGTAGTTLTVRLEPR